MAQSVSWLPNCQRSLCYSSVLSHKHDSCPMNTEAPSVPVVSADLLLVHAPAFFDFRERRDIYFPFLGTSGDVPITPLYEYFPIGFRTVQRFLSERGFEVRLMNLSTILLRYPKIDLGMLIDALDVRLLGIDLHWMVHVQGSLAVAELIKKRRPDLPVIFGGISSTYYAEELIQYPFVDMVMQGYDTHEPLAMLLQALTKGTGLQGVPNLLWKSGGEQTHDNGLSYMPRTYGCGVDWSKHPKTGPTQTLPILELLSTQNVGCAYNCPWCGGSREAFRRIFRCRHPVARKPSNEVAFEFETVKKLDNAGDYHFYSVGSYNESRAGMEFFLDRVGEVDLRSISYEQYYLTSDPVLKRMVEANKRTIITLSPESHDPKVAKLAGRGVYTNDELEGWLDRALSYGIYQIDIWYFIGMPEQDEQSVLHTVDYCCRLLSKFKGRRINPMICPMIPFLDPGSSFFENPDKHGYRVFSRTVEQHRRAMERASIINRINYETRWLSRSDLVYVGYEAVKTLMEAKAELGYLPSSWVEQYAAMIKDAMDFLRIVHQADCLEDKIQRNEELNKLGDEIEYRNAKVLFSGVSNQAFPVNRDIGGRWFDEMLWDPAALEALQKR